MIKVSDLQGAALDYWVGKAERRDDVYIGLSGVCRVETEIEYPQVEYSPSTGWGDGGPLIEKYGLCVEQCPPAWWANVPGEAAVMGETPLQAICRAVVRAAFGDEVEEVLP